MHLHSVLSTCPALVNHQIAHVGCSPPFCLSNKSSPPFTSQSYCHSSKSLLCRLHPLTEHPWTSATSWLVHRGTGVMLSPSSSLLSSSSHTSFIPLPLNCPLYFSQMGMNQEYDARSTKLVFQKQLSWNSELSIWFLKGRFPDELLIPFLIPLRFPGGLSDGVFVSAGNGVSSSFT